MAHRILLNSGDSIDEGELQTAFAALGDGYIEQGALGIQYFGSDDTIDTEPALARIPNNNQEIPLYVDAITGYSLEANAINNVWLTVDPSAASDDAAVALAHNTTGVAPPDPSLLIAKVDTNKSGSAAVTLTNRGAAPALDGTDLNPRSIGRGTPALDIAATEAEIDDLNGEIYVAAGDSIQQAHDDLPVEGGVIRLTETVSETGIKFTKPTKLVGQTSGTNTSGLVEVDTSGGPGIHLATHGCTLRDVQISGDETGSYGLKIGNKGAFDASGHRCDNVTVVDKGGSGVVITGGQQNNKLDIRAVSCKGHGWLWDPAGGDFFNANAIQRLDASYCGKDGLHIANKPSNDSAFAGNTIDQFRGERNNGWGFYVEEGVKFQANKISGYGTEGSGTGAIKINPIHALGKNHLDVRFLKSTVDIPTGAFASIAVGQHDVDLLGRDAGDISDYLHDDWGDGAIRQRSPSVRGWFRDASVSSPQSPLVGRDRPRWGQVTGNTAPVVDGVVEMPTGGSSGLKTSSTLRFGTWEFDFRFQSDPTSGALQLFIMDTDKNDARVLVSVNHDGNVSLLVDDYSGTQVASGFGAISSLTNRHTVSVTHDNNDKYELFIDGTSAASFVEVSYPSTTRLSFSSYANAVGEMHEMRAY